MTWVFRHGIMINRPIEVVFTWVTDPTKATHWHLDLVEAKILTSGPIRVGTRIKETRWLGISKLHILREIIRYEPPIKYDYTYLDGCGCSRADSTPGDRAGRCLSCCRRARWLL